MSAEDRALLPDAQGSDLRARGPPPITLNQPLSPAVLPGEGHVQNAVVGGYVVPWNGTWISVERYHSLIVAFGDDHREYRPNRGGLAMVHPARPGDARWHDDKTPKGFYRDGNDNPVEETISCIQLIVGLKPASIGGVFRFARSALEVGRALCDRAQRLRIEGENISGMVLGLWEWSSRLKQANGTNFYLPVVTSLGKLGEANGPSLELVRFAAQLRQKFREGLPWQPDPSVQPLEIAPQIEKLAQRRGSVEIRPGRGAWDEPPPEQAPPPDRYDGPDDQIEF